MSKWIKLSLAVVMFAAAGVLFYRQQQRQLVPKAGVESETREVAVDVERAEPPEVTSSTEPDLQTLWRRQVETRRHTDELVADLDKPWAAVREDYIGLQREAAELQQQMMELREELRPSEMRPAVRTPPNRFRDVRGRRLGERLDGPQGERRMESSFLRSRLSRVRQNLIDLYESDGGLGPNEQAERASLIRHREDLRQRISGLSASADARSGSVTSDPEEEHERHLALMAELRQLDEAAAHAELGGEPSDGMVEEAAAIRRDLERALASHRPSQGRVSVPAATEPEAEAAGGKPVVVAVIGNATSRLRREAVLGADRASEPIDPAPSRVELIDLEPQLRRTGGVTKLDLPTLQAAAGAAGADAVLVMNASAGATRLSVASAGGATAVSSVMVGSRDPRRLHENVLDWLDQVLPRVTGDEPGPGVVSVREWRDGAADQADGPTLRTVLLRGALRSTGFEVLDPVPPAATGAAVPAGAEVLEVSIRSQLDAEADLWVAELTWQEAGQQRVEVRAADPPSETRGQLDQMVRWVAEEVEGKLPMSRVVAGDPMWDPARQHLLRSRWLLGTGGDERLSVIEAEAGLMQLDDPADRAATAKQLLSLVLSVAQRSGRDQAALLSGGLTVARHYRLAVERAALSPEVDWEQWKAWPIHTTITPESLTHGFDGLDTAALFEEVRRGHQRVLDALNLRTPPLEVRDYNRFASMLAAVDRPPAEWLPVYLDAIASTTRGRNRGGSAAAALLNTTYLFARLPDLEPGQVERLQATLAASKDPHVRILTHYVEARLPGAETSPAAARAIVDHLVKYAPTFGGRADWRSELLSEVPDSYHRVWALRMADAAEADPRRWLHEESSVRRKVQIQLPSERLERLLALVESPEVRGEAAELADLTARRLRAELDWREPAQVVEDPWQRWELASLPRGAGPRVRGRAVHVEYSPSFRGHEDVLVVVLAVGLPKDNEEARTVAVPHQIAVMPTTGGQMSLVQEFETLHPWSLHLMGDNLLVRNGGGLAVLTPDGISEAEHFDLSEHAMSRNWVAGRHGLLVASGSVLHRCDVNLENWRVVASRERVAGPTPLDGRNFGVKEMIISDDGSTAWFVASKELFRYDFDSGSLEAVGDGFTHLGRLGDTLLAQGRRDREYVWARLDVADAAVEPVTREAIHPLLPDRSLGYLAGFPVSDEQLLLVESTEVHLYTRRHGDRVIDGYGRPKVIRLGGNNFLLYHANAFLDEFGLWRLEPRLPQGVN